MKNKKVLIKKVSKLSQDAFVDEILPDVDHDIEGVTFEGKPLSAWSIEGMLDSLKDD